MRQPKTSGTTFGAPPAPATWMKYVFFAEIAVFAIGAPVLWDQWESARSDLAIKTRELASKRQNVESLKRENGNAYEFLTKYNNDADFRMRVARQRLGYTEPGEIVFRLDPPPPGAAPRAENTKP